MKNKTKDTHFILFFTLPCLDSLTFHNFFMYNIFCTNIYDFLLPCKQLLGYPSHDMDDVET